MAILGVKRFDDLIGRSELLCKQAVINHWKAKDIDLTKILWKPDTKNQKENFNSSYQNHDIDDVLDLKVIKEAKDVINGIKRSTQINKLIKNTDRSFGAMLSGEIAKKYGHKGLMKTQL